MVGGNVDHIHRRDLYSAARPSRRNCLITRWCGCVSSSTRLLWESLRKSWLLPPFTRAFWICSRWHLQHWVHTVTTLVTTAEWRRVWNRVRTTAQWTFQTRHSTRQSHGLFALAQHLYIHITGSALALHCCKGHARFQGIQFYRGRISHFRN